MLELRNIVKDYVNGNNVTHALKGISVTFRKNEFVSILGASGCGKTTLLNIIGGLDRYTSGDLLILGRSTKEYKDRDWDTYRNHSIGFVFQTYNLIAHQNILKNVELALTISGVTKEERRQRAYDALKLVGLEGMEKKKPNQLSGGQCQRVAIARALINNPEILLADEPTGALDSETSVQIMDLLKEVASDRLVIMVTHNPELAEKYSTRIINMHDGLLIKDSNPFEYDSRKEVTAERKEVESTAPSKGKKKQTSMSIWTSIGLSTSNLLSKMKRTVLVTIAGSIGIIGVSAVLGVSRGVRDYISDLQNDMLSSYPLSIAEESVDYTALISGLNQQDKKEKFEFDPNNPKVGVDSMISYLMSAYSDLTNVKTNTIDEKMLDFIDKMSKDEVGALSYKYGIDPTNNIFGKWKDQKFDEEKYYSFNGLTQRYIAELKTVSGFSSYASFVDLFTSFMNELPENDEYVLNQYDIIEGEYTTAEDKLMLVVDQDTTLTDVLLAQMGIFDHDSFINVAKCAMKTQEAKKDPEFEKKSTDEKNQILDQIKNDYPYPRDFTYGDLIGRDFYYFPQDTIYSKDDHVADDKITISTNFSILDGGGNLDTFVTLDFQSYAGYNLLFGTGVFKDGSTYKTSSLACLNIEMSGGTINVKSADPSYVVDSKDDLSGTWYAFDPTDLIGMDTSSASELMSKLKFILTIDTTIEDGTYKKTLFSPGQAVTLSWEETPDPVAGYSYEAIAEDSWISNPSSVSGIPMKIGGILRLKDSKNFGSLSRGLYYSKAFSDKYINDSKDAILTTALKDHMKSKLTNNTDFNQAYVKFPYYDYKLETKRTDGYASTLNADLSASFSDLFSGLTGVNYMERNTLHLRSLCGYKAIVVNDEEGEFKDVEFKHLPREIVIYPKSFDGKSQITDYLDKWNSDAILNLDDGDGAKDYTKAQRDDLTYTDTISLIVAVIDTFINAITIALVVFTSLSLVVSCFMIAVITYISVVERIKEIGVIRSLGGRKRDVAGLFIMETLMTGLFSGIFGITMTYILEIIVNIILKSLFGIAIMNLTIPTALLMIGISVTLSVLSGLIPSQSAAHKDPVVALRSNE